MKKLSDLYSGYPDIDIKDIKIKTTYKRRNKDEELKKNCTLLCYDACGIYGCCLWNE